MKQNLIAGFILIFLLVILYYLLFTYIVTGVEKEQNLQKELVGMKVLYNKDTVLVIDYSCIPESYKLSNGMEVSREYITIYKLP